MTPRAYARGVEFPHEGFVQGVLEAHFSACGYDPLPSGDADFACIHPTTGECWVIEAKGLTSAVGLDFRTGLGQLLQRMTSPGKQYAVAVPDLPSFISQCRQVPDWVRVALGLHWLVIASDRTVKVYKPDEPVGQPASA
jgi:hypothetical protein